MSSQFDRFEELDAILREVLAFEPLDRPGAIRRLCGEDSATKEQVEKLLQGIAEGTLDPAVRVSESLLSEMSRAEAGGSLRHRKLLHYEIDGKIGQGGMGEVYRAKDQKLGREVAIKVLPESLSRDRERLLRFAREARVLAALNHPNIAQVYGFEEDRGVHFLVMELAEGETLAERLERGPLPLEEALPIAIQIADGLEAAHKQGIIHRDLKPANVALLTDSSRVVSRAQVKLLDFGLAKNLPVTQAAQDLANSPTLTQHTVQGVLLGTAAYMAPEQARGRHTDHRSDIWGFGCLLYEMLTGERAFRGDDVSDTLASVLRDTPDWPRMPTQSPTLRRVLEHCLEKDPARRWHHIADVRLELEHVSGAESDGPEAISTTSGRLRSPLVWVLGTAFLVAIAFGFGRWTSLERQRPTSSTTSGIVRSTFEAPQPGTVFALNFNSVSVSADGRRVAVAGKGPSGSAIWVRELGDSEWRALPGSELGHTPTISPDGEWVVFDRGHSPAGRSHVDFLGGNTFRAPFDGGSLVGPLGLLAEGWSVDSELLGFRGSRVVIVGSDGREDTFLECESCDLSMGTFERTDIEAVSRDAVMVTLHGAIAGERGSGDESGPHLYLWTRGSAPQRVVEQAQQPMIVGDRLIFVRRGELWAVSLDSSGRPTGAEIATGVRAFSSAQSKRLHLDVAGETGTLLYLDAFTEDYELWELDAQGLRRRKVPLSGPIGIPPYNMFLRTSPAGTHALAGGITQLRVVSLEDGLLSRPIPLHHGSWLNDEIFAATSYSSSEIALFDLEARTMRKVQLVGEGAISGATRPGSSLHLFHRFVIENGVNVSPYTSIFVKDLASDSPEELWYTSDGFDRFPTFSPDGSWVAFETDSAGRMEVNVSRWPGLPDPIPVSNEGGQLPRWSKDGKTLFFVDSDSSHLMAAAHTPGSSRPFSQPRELFAIPEGTVVTQRVGYDTLPGDRFLFAISPEPPRHRLVLNWIAEVEEILAAANP